MLDPAKAAPSGHPGVKVSEYIPTLDGWCAVAILAVMASHSASELFGPAGILPSPAIFAASHQGARGVDLFFGLSGFLICSRLISEHRRTGKVSLAGFYVRRFFRIFPPYYAYLAVVAALGVAGILAIEVPEILSCVFFCRNYYRPASYGPYTAHFWTLAVEEHFYLLWPGLFVVLISAGGPKVARRFAFFASLLIAGWRAVDSRYQLFARYVPINTPGTYFRTDARLDALLLGCWIALLVAEPAWRERLARWLSPAAWTLLASAFFGSILAGLEVPMISLYVALLVPVILVGTALHPESWAGRLLEIPALRWIGRLSYSLYLWQQLFLTGWFQSPAFPIQRLPFNWIASFACAVASFYLVERPMIRLGHRIAARVGP